VVRHTISVLTGLTLLFSAGCTSSPVKIAPPRVAQGGRALSIAVVSNNDQRMVVATETGGLFRTFDGGKSWQHLDFLPNFKTVDVAIASLAPDTIIATTQPQYRAVNDGGIWRSTDGGGVWIQATNWAPPPSPTCPDRPGAFGISHMPLSHTFYVATDCGLAVSNDDGANWSPVPNLNTRFRSVLVINRTSGVAAADTGIFHLDNNGIWTMSQPIASSGVPVPHAFAAPWFTGSGSIFFHASGDQKLWLSTDSGANWSQVAAPSINVREAFVRVGRSLANDDTKFEVYYGDGMRLHRQTFSLNGPTGTGNWVDLKSDHDDPSDIAFDLEFRVPILLASDGGVHRTADQGATWVLTGGGFGGFDALQISEVTGQVSGTPPQQFLYYGTQDNDLKASSDGGGSWTGSICCEGRFIRAGAGRITGSNCGPCSNFLTAPGFQSQTSWPNAPNGSAASPADAPFLLSGDLYIQDVTNTGTAPPSFDFFVTSTAGASWSKSFSLPFTPKGATIVAGPASNPTVFQGVQAAGALPNGGTRFGLVRATGLFGQASVSPADGSGSIAIGSLRVPIARYMVVGVDPNNPNHLIAPDAENSEMKYSADGGATWIPLPQLTQAVTGGGQYLFELGELSLASVIAFDPSDSCHILVGTIQNGIIRSTDGGNTWAQIQGSKFATYVSSFFFPPTGFVWVSTNGRGLWTLDLSRSGTKTGQCRFPSPPGNLPGNVVVAIDPATGSSRPFQGLKDSDLCSSCSIVVVRNGWVTDLQMSDDKIREIAISGGTIAQLDRGGKEVPLGIANVYRQGDGKLRSRIPRNAELGSGRVRALLLEGNRLRLVIVSASELPFAPERTPMIFLYSASKIGGSSVASGEKVRVIGANFLRASRTGTPVQISFDGKVVAQRIQVRADGTFSVDIPVQHLPGEMVATAEQRDGNRLTMTRAIIDVVAEGARR